MILRAALGVILAMLMLGSVPPVEFEGVVESRNTTVDELGKQQQFVMTIWVKKGMLKIHNTAVGSTPAYTVIYRSDRKTIWTLNDDEQTYFEVLQSDMPQGGTGKAGENGSSITRTGKKKKILGYPCEQFLFNDGDQETEIWGTTKLGTLSQTISEVIGQEESGSWTDELAKKGVFPLIESTKLGGTLVDSQVVYRIERQSLPASIFDLPAGYKKQSVQNLMEQK